MCQALALRLPTWRRTVSIHVRLSLSAVLLLSVLLLLLLLSVPLVDVTI